MRQIVSVVPLILMAVALYVLTGCDKHIDKLPAESSFCNVRMINSPSLNPEEIGPTDTIRFSYDGYGNPLSIGRLLTATELNDYIFRYDRQHRLTDLIGVFSLQQPEEAGFDTWDKYYYENGRIALDTTFQFGLYTGGTRPIPYLPEDSSLLIRRISSYEYDHESRISQTKDIFADKSYLVTTYFYNGNGNLAKTLRMIFGPQGNFPPGIDSSVYAGFDNKVNPNRTNPIWQFLDREYSMNLQYRADKYDEIGLPTAFSGSQNSANNLVPFPFIFLHSYISGISYGCGMP